MATTASGAPDPADREGVATVVTNPTGPVHCGLGTQINHLGTGPDPTAEHTDRQRRAADRHQRAAQRRAARQHPAAATPAEHDAVPTRTGGIGRITATNLTHIDHPDGPVNLGTGHQIQITTSGDGTRIDLREDAVRTSDNADAPDDHDSDEDGM
jgi:hypothetical protein